MIREVVTSLGYESETVGDGPGALRQVAAYQPDVVLLDMWLPTVSGLAVLQVLRRDHPELPVIMVTANQD